jgi:hypothetical protein
LICEPPTSTTRTFIDRQRCKLRGGSAPHRRRAAGHRARGIGDLLDDSEHIDDRVEGAVDDAVFRVRADGEFNRAVAIHVIDAVL